MDAHDHLSVVDGSKITWNVRVHVTRIWRSTTTNGVIVRWNLLLLDSEVIQSISVHDRDIKTISNIFLFVVNPEHSRASIHYP